MMILWDQQSGGMGEDCLVLNIWTPGVNDGAKRAVLVSFHGGGFATGSGNAPGFDGAQLALFGDVVVVTVNHRLASYGYTHLCRSWRTTRVCVFGCRWSDGPRCLTGMGENQHREFRW